MKKALNEAGYDKKNKEKLEKKEETLEKALELIVNANKRKYGKKNILENLIKNKNIKLDQKELKNISK